MHTLISAEGLTHMELFAQAQIARGNTVGLYTTTPTFKLHRGMPKEVQYHFFPGPVELLRGGLMNRVQMPRSWEDWDTVFFDTGVSKRIEKADMLLASASGSLLTGRAIQRMGGKYVVDRGCPDIRFQEHHMQEESAKAGGTFLKAPDWFMKRQLDEYDECDFLVVPSEYSRRTYPSPVREKTLVLRLTGSVRTVAEVPTHPERPFTVGVVGGQPARKGYLYLLQAWQQLGWADCKLLLRTNVNLLKKYPVLEKLVASMPNVEIVPFVADIADFYKRCDTFILPSTEEGFGLSLFEAIGQGIPCITTTNCGAAELLEPERDIVLIEPFSTDAIKHSLERMRDSPELRDTLARNGLERVRLLGQADLQDEYRKGVDELMARAFPS